MHAISQRLDPKRFRSGDRVQVSVDGYGYFPRQWVDGEVLRTTRRRVHIRFRSRHGVTLERYYAPCNVRFR